MRAWQIDTIDRVCAASADPNACYNWILEVFQDDSEVTFANFAKSTKKFTNLDFKLAVSVTALSKQGELGLKIANIKDERQRTNPEEGPLRGRQILRIVVEYFRGDSKKGGAYSIRDLAQVKWLGDKKAGLFLQVWDMTIRGMVRTPNDDDLEIFLADQIKQSEALKFQYAHYDTALEGSDYRSYRYLRTILEQYIEKSRSTKNTGAIGSVLAGNATALAALGLGDKGKGGGKGKKKTKKAKKGGGKGKSKTKAPALSAITKSCRDHGLCIKFNNGETCNKDTCKYKHEKPPKAPPKKPAKPGKTPAKAPKDKNKSKAPKPALAVPKLCKAYDGVNEDSCPKGGSCGFLHVTNLGAIGKAAMLAALPRGKGFKTQGSTSGPPQRDPSHPPNWWMRQGGAKLLAALTATFAASLCPSTAPLSAPAGGWQLAPPDYGPFVNTPAGPLLLGAEGPGLPCNRSAPALSAVRSILQDPALQYVLDSGSEFHLVGERDLSREGWKRVREAIEDVYLATASGPEAASRELTGHFDVLGGVRLVHKVLRNSPAVVSMGRLIENHGFSFHWMHGSTPVLVFPDGEKLELPCHGHVPYLPPGVVDSALHKGQKLKPGAEQMSYLPCTPAVAPVPSEPSRADDPEEPALPFAGAQSGPKESIQHLFGHFYHDPKCWACMLGHWRASPHRRRAAGSGEKYGKVTRFGELVLGDHISLETQDFWSVAGDTFCLVLQDWYTRLIGAFPAKGKSGLDCDVALTEFLGDRPHDWGLRRPWPARMFTDDSKELSALAKSRGSVHSKSQHYEHQTNADAEVANQKILKIARTITVASRMPISCWNWAFPFAAVVVNVGDGGDVTPWVLRYERDFEANLYPYGALVKYRPPGNRNEVERVHKAADNAIEGLFVGYDLDPVQGWAGTYKIVRLHDMMRYIKGEANSPAVVHPRDVRFPEVPTFPLVAASLQIQLQEIGEAVRAPVRPLPDLPSSASGSAGAVADEPGEPPAVSNEPSGSADGAPADIQSKSKALVDKDSYESLETENWALEDFEEAIDALDLKAKALKGELTLLEQYGGGTDSNGIPIAIKKSTRPRHMHSDVWERFSVPERAKYEKELEARRAGIRTKIEGATKARDELKVRFASLQVSDTSGPAGLAKALSLPAAAALAGGTTITADSDELWAPESCLSELMSKQLPLEAPCLDQEEYWAKLDKEHADGLWTFGEDGARRKDITYPAALAPRQEGSNSKFTPEERAAALAKLRYLLSDPIQSHRPKNTEPPPLWSALVTKALHPADPLCRTREAKAALKSELDSHIEGGTWEHEKPVEYDRLKEEFPDAHFADLFGIIGIKNFESSNKADHSWKGRIVFGGHKIKDSAGLDVFFNELTSTPSTFQAERCILAAHCCNEGYTIQQSDCLKAYVQAELKGVDTFVRLPRDWWPPSWFDKDGNCLYKRPYVRLVKALYGHPIAGECWHQKFASALNDLGFFEVEAWPSVFVNEDSGLAVIIYVDDMVALGPPADLKKFFGLLAKQIKFDDPTDLSKYLGVHHVFTHDKASGERAYDLSMSDFIRSTVDVYVQKTGKTLKAADTPYAPELPKDQTSRLMTTPGEFAKHSASLLMKPLYGARAVRPDLCVAIQQLASEVTRWSGECDRRCHRLYQYMHGSCDEVLKGRLSYRPGTTYRLSLSPDADLNGNPFTSKSTSGGWLELVDSHGNTFPISWGAKKQDCTARHTCEAETYSLDTWLRGDGVPAQILLSKLLRKPIDMDVFEDNAACIISVAKGYSPAMRYLPRSLRTSLGKLNELTSDDWNPFGLCRVVKKDTKEHKGDFFTKALNAPSFREGKARIGLGPRVDTRST